MGPSNDSGIRMLTGNHNPRPPQSLENGHIYCILLIRIMFCHVSTSTILSLCCLFYVTMNTYFYSYLNIVRDVVTGLFMFVDIYHFYHNFPHAHIEAHTHTSTRVWLRNGERAQEPGWEWRKKVFG